MNVTSIDIEGFMKHGASQVKFPPHGVVLVTGPNGAGKSSMVEAVATALWGETLRGTSPWSGEKGHAVVNTDLVHAARTFVNGRKALDWQPVAGDTRGAFESTSKAQLALEAVVGTYDLWRRTHVFSSQDAAHFTLATDSERKRFLEATLDLDRFDGALTRCREDRRDTERRLEASRMALGTLKARLSSEEARVADWTKVLAELPEVPPATVNEAELSKAVKMVQATDSDVNGMQRKIADLKRAGLSEEAQMHEVQRRLAALRSERCDRCSQAIPQSLRDGLQAEVQALQEKANKARAAARAEAEALEVDLADLQAEREALRDRASALKAARDNHQRQAQARRDAETALKRSQDALSDTAAQLDNAHDEAYELETCLGVLGAVDTVLGMKGVRSQLLGRALTGVETVANAWLSRIAGEGFRLRLKPYTEKKSGGVSDSISLEVEGAGGGHGYKASSGGERRRIDVALLLALAEVSAAARGRVPGTLFMDEVFDALDEEGVDAVSDALQDLARNRAVVVITHNQALSARTQAALRLRVAGGVVKAA